MNIFVAMATATLRLGTPNEMAIRAPGQMMLEEICHLSESSPRIELKDEQLTIRLSVYGPMELIGPPACRRVHFFILDEKLGRKFEKFTKRSEEEKKYYGYYEVALKGYASFDQTSGDIRVNLFDMSFLREVPLSKICKKNPCFMDCRHSPH